ncbi:hypothetical protein LPE509_02054 [Legionella pneumophila subsp. pneumophila LPE509]|nr:hypothetical protein LPE509_02054 [Legionella pneumophila subsp. pneumophila LPE509]
MVDAIHNQISQIIMGFCLFELNRVHDLSIGTENSDNIYKDKFMYYF